MRMLLCKWNGCSEPGLERAFQTMGMTVDTVFYEFGGADYSVECLELLRTKFDANRYDFVFSHNFIPIISKVCKIYKIKYISWVMDSPAYHLYSDAVMNTCNYIFIFDKLLYQQFVHRNPGHIFYYPLATCMGEWDKVDMLPHPDRDFKADVSFLGSMYVDECHYDEVENMPDYMRGYMEGLIEAQLNVYGYNFLEDVLSQEMAEKFAKIANWNQPEDYIRDVKMVVSQTYLGQKCAQIERFRIADALHEANANFKLYTYSELPAHLKQYNMGTADYYTEMPFIFRESKINLNITSKSIRSGLSLRMFDIMGCGGFLLTNYQPELPDYFEIGKELAVYESIPHLVEQVQYYLTHEEERIEIAKRGYEKVRSFFTYDIALREMLSMADIKM